jgi:DNA-directed RNA polymerase sigma subunit (sigma70/sigma32)
MTAGTSGWLDLAIRAQLNWSNLTAERERQLLRVCQTATDESERQSALTDLWESHSKLVIAIASRYRQPNIELADLIGAGHLGLHAAIARFDVDRFDGRLANYAIGWIRWHIQDYIRRNAAPVRLPATAGCLPTRGGAVSASRSKRPMPNCVNGSDGVSAWQPMRSRAAYG